MPRVLTGPTAKLNAADEKSENEKSRENAEPYFTTPRRDYCTTPKRLCDHSPKLKRRTPIRQFLALCVRNCISSNRPSPQQQPFKNGAIANPTSGIRLWSYRADYSVDRSPCASHGTVRNVLGGNHRAFRHVPRRVDRPSLSDVNAANTKTEREKY